MARADITDAERVRGLLGVNARQAERIQIQARDIALMHQRLNRQRIELEELRERVAGVDDPDPPPADPRET